MAGSEFSNKEAVDVQEYALRMTSDSVFGRNRQFDL